MKIIRFRDVYDYPCSIKYKSSDEPIRLGLVKPIIRYKSNETDKYKNFVFPQNTKMSLNGSMCINRHLAEQLWPILKEFSETGEISDHVIDSNSAKLIEEEALDDSAH